ncbi:MAG: cytochrome P460 family protein [Ferruginibacter sp.]
MKKLLQKKWVRVMIVIALLFVGMQFIKTDIDNPPIVSDIVLPPIVKTMFKNACYDCHSNETKLSWFDKIVPADWLVAKHIREGRAAVNFSEWQRLSDEQHSAALFESLNLMQYQVMPLRQYELLHQAAEITAIEIDSFKSYLKTLLIVQVPDTNKIRNWNEQYSKWLQAAADPKIVMPAPNGISFMADYKNWVAIGSSERSDKGTLRVIVGNAVTVKAIKENHTNQWPDGSALAKIIWVQTLDSLGNIHAGEFTQVDFMIKNKEKYPATGGWGYARWAKGIQLKPYGSNAFFTTECANCHRSMKDNDYVFTTPVSLVAYPGLEDKVITSFVNKTNGTMTTLYGNDIAASFVRTHARATYPEGSVLTMVTWFQKEDAHWFGATVTGNIKSIEKVRFSNAGQMNTSPSYERFEGSPLVKATEISMNDSNKRLSFMLSQQASVMP